MITRFLAAVLILLPAICLAQSKVVIGGVDQRVPPLEGQYLAQQVAEKAQQAAHAAALLAVEKVDREEAENRATATKAWLDQAWREMEYWRAYAGFTPKVTQSQ